MKKKLILYFTLIVISMFAVSCNAAEKSEQALPDLGAIKVGYMPLVSVNPVFIAYEKGYFADEGLEVELESFQSSTYMMPLLATGDLDLGFGQTGTDLINAIHQGLDIRVVSPAAAYEKGYVSQKFLVRKDLYESGEITEPADLKEAVIATIVERGLIEFLTASILEMGGLTIEDIQFVTMPFSDMNVALANNAIDAAMLPEPLAGMAADSGDGVILFEMSEVFPGANTAVYYFGQRLIQPENREIGVRVLKALYRAIRELYTIEGYNDENIGYITKYVNNPPEYVRDNRYYFSPTGEFDISFVEKTMKYYIDQGYTDTQELPDPDLLYDFSYLEAALERLGPFEE